MKQNADNAAGERAWRGRRRKWRVREAKRWPVVQTMSSIHQSSAKIADIIGVIDGSPSRPTSWTLNAAVEAARAGNKDGLCGGGDGSGGICSSAAQAAAKETGD